MAGDRQIDRISPPRTPPCASIEFANGSPLSGLAPVPWIRLRGRMSIAEDVAPDDLRVTYGMTEAASGQPALLS